MFVLCKKLFKLKYFTLLQFQHGVAPIPKSVTTSRIKENMEIFDFELTLDEMNTIQKLGNGERVAGFSM